MTCWKWTHEDGSVEYIIDAETARRHAGPMLERLNEALAERESDQ